ncbi:cofactor-independent phosphoglycerate mutase [archaeon BMS3Abin16]|nr:cofactor-independent phosphoglycerate mutase [archaeon BMS3Abin16]
MVLHNKYFKPSHKTGVMKCLLLICDGMADRPVKTLRGRTPLEAADTRNLDLLAKSGILGIVDTIAPGIRPGSDTAHLAILGYDPVVSYTGRGPFEAAGVGLDVTAGEIAFRCNFATVDENGLVVDRRAGRISEGTQELAEAVNGIKIPGAHFRFRASTGHRGALVMSGKGLSHNISESDPHEEGVKPHVVEPLDGSEEARRTADMLNRFILGCGKVLAGHPVNVRRIQEGLRLANTLLLRGVGVAPSLAPFSEKYGFRAGCIATVALVRGVGRFCGLEVIGADAEMSIPGLVSMAIDATSKYDFVLLNIKAADDASHDGDAEKKTAVIEEIDRALAGLLDFTVENYLAILSDHTTSISRRDHTGDPVPILIAGPEVRTDDTAVFSERAAAKGGLGRIRGQDIMNILVDLMNRSEKFGA